ncbi:STM4015 family protein [Flammeovirga sp. EKP202]|uniref:STM4015 family protein n=1 Tax=Flammeovirga sp. EKP202 TaxID=2770592 RepID=UPI00165F8BFB|nr:STM4015 family protein [Flammeovirga sp. EKP202]MBD0400430.1 STM4015 family protein [Flammeovirga sp. EKP202]
MATDFFYNKKVHQFTTAEGITEKNSVYRLGLEYMDDEDQKLIELIDAFLKDPNLKEVVGLSIGIWADAYDSDCESIINKLVQEKEHLQHIEALFIGDMDYDECEISWIQQTNLNAIFKNFPNLKVFQIKGSEGLALGEIEHQNLETLVIQSGGLSKNVLQEIGNATLPKLKHLELWLGTDDYGYDGEVEADILPLLEEGQFPLLFHLGLQNCIDADDIVQLISVTPLQETILSLDLSMGTLGDKSAEGLLNAPCMPQLCYLNLSSNYLSSGIGQKIKEKFPHIELKMGEQKEEDVYDDETYRYVDVGE